MKTQSINRIMIPMDFSETALLAMEQAAFMARLFKAELYMLHVIEVMEFAYSIYDPSLAVPLDNEDIEKNVALSLAELENKIKKEYGVEPIPLIRCGRVAGELGSTAEEYKIDLIVMGTHGAKGLEEFFIGSNAHKIVTHSPCPVLTIQKDSHKIGFGSIIMPIDNTLHSREKTDTVLMLASHYGSFVHILGLTEKGEEEDEPKLIIKIEAVEKQLKHANIGYDRKIVTGHNLAEETLKYAAQVDAELIVIMTDHESKLTGMFLGAAAKQIINHSKIPVLSIRPHVHAKKGFVVFDY